MAILEMEHKEVAADELKSPVRKLRWFFQRSRDGWKAKYKAKKRECRLKDNQVRAVEKSREKWKDAARQAQEEVRQLQRELEQYKNSGP